MSEVKRKRCLEFQENSVTNQGHWENGNESPAWALEVPLIFQLVMNYLSVRDILHNCSLVNKFWCHEARSFLRDKRTCTLCTALITTSGDLKAVKTLMNSNVIPFNRIPVYCSEEFSRGGKPPMVQLEQQILQLIQMMKLKRLYIYEDELKLECDRRMSRNIIEHALRKKNGTIEEISLCCIPHQEDLRLGQVESSDVFGKFIRGILTSENFSLPALRTLTFHRQERVWPGLLENCVIPTIAIARKLKNVFLTLPLLKPVVERALPVLPPEHVRLLKRVRFNIELFKKEEWDGFLTNANVECKHLELVLFCRRRRFVQHELLGILGHLGSFLMRNRNSIAFLVTDVPIALTLQENGLLELFPRLQHLCIGSVITKQ